jgi:hypothetical protein
MSRIDENLNENPDCPLDRLVDGELSETDRRTLLLQLEREPEGWRRCALAFLEAQCWKQELGPMAGSSDEAVVGAAAAVGQRAVPRLAAERRSSWRQYLATALTLGACFLIALALGMGLRGSRGSLHGPGSQITTVRDEVPLNSQTAPVAGSSDKWELVTLSADSPGGQAETVQIPAVRRQAFDQGLFEQSSNVVPPEVQRVFERAGHEVLQQREIVPVPMQGGHRLMVPVDHVEIHYVGRGSL